MNTIVSTRKKCKLVHAKTLTSSGTTTTSDPDPIDWSLCALCQEPSNEILKYPAKSLRTDTGAGYDTLGDDLKCFLELGKQPIPIDIRRLSEGDSIGKFLSRNQAQWHASCRLKCSASRLARAKAKATICASGDAEGSQYMLRGAKRRSPSVEHKCLFCGEVGTKTLPLHKAMTPQVTH